MVEAMVALTLVDHLMMQQAQCELFPDTTREEDRPNPMGKTARRTHARVATAASGPVSQRVDEE